MSVGPNSVLFIHCAYKAVLLYDNVVNTTSRRQNRLPTATLTDGSSTVSPVSSVRDLGIFVDSDLVMRTHVSDGVALLCCIASAAQHSSPRLGDRLSVACYCFSTQPAGLR